MNCPIRGHDHELRVASTHTQDGTGTTAKTFECPSGNYRWFLIDGKVPDADYWKRMRQHKPRWGWKK